MKIQWNQMTWYSKILALILLIALPFAGFYIGTIYQKAVSPTETQIKTASGSVTIKNPNPGALNVKDVLANPDKYTNQKVKVEARIDISTDLTSVMCEPGTTLCQQYQGNIFLKDINDDSTTNEEIELAEKTRTDPSTYQPLTCMSVNQPIKTCLNYTRGNLTEIEGTLVYVSGAYLLVI